MSITNLKKRVKRNYILLILTPFLFFTGVIASISAYRNIKKNTGLIASHYTYQKKLFTKWLYIDTAGIILCYASDIPFNKNTPDMITLAIIVYLIGFVTCIYVLVWIIRKSLHGLKALKNEQEIAL